MDKEVIDKYQTYLTHQKGLALFWLWLEQWSSIKGWEVDGTSIKLSRLCSQRFVLGIPKKNKKRKVKDLFLGVQKTETDWLKRIQWKCVVWDKNQSKLWLVSDFCISPDNDWPDLPSIAVGINIDPVEILDNWSKNKLSWRSLWWDEDNNLHVDRLSRGSWNVRRGSLLDNWSKSEREGLVSLKDIVNRKISSTNNPINPGYQGAMADIPSDLKDLVKPYERDNNGNYIEKQYPELFGQFLDDEK